MIVIDEKFLAPVLEKAAIVERKRTNYNFHKFAGDTLQRMLNVLNTGTYLRPHKHVNPDKREAFVILEGKVAVIEFEELGMPSQCVVLDPRNKVYGCEIEPGKWHGLVCLEDNTVLYEVKDGPYIVETDKVFAPWSPEEGSVGAQDYIQKLITELNLEIKN
jgi:cupin fold WbuC family metalloprotein